MTDDQRDSSETEVSEIVFHSSVPTA